MKILPILCILAFVFWTVHNTAVSSAQVPPKSECSPPGRCPVNALGPNGISSCMLTEALDPVRRTLGNYGLYHAVLNVQRLLVLVFCADVRNESSNVCRRLVRLSIRNSMRQHDWQVFEPDSSGARRRLFRALKRNSMFRRNSWVVHRVSNPAHGVRYHRCACWVACFIDVRVLANVMTPTLGPQRRVITIVYTPQRQRGGGQGPAKRHLPSEINPFLTDEYEPLCSGDRVLYHAHHLHNEVHESVINDPCKVLAVVPLRSLASALSKKQLTEIAVVHDIAVPSRCSIDRLVAAVVNHECHCDPTVSVFEVLTDVVERQTTSHRARNAAYKKRVKVDAVKPTRKFKASEALRTKRKLTKQAAKKRRSKICVATTDDEKVEFPPAPATRALRHAILTDMCSDFEPKAFEEAGCAVCGRLCRLQELTSMNDVDVEWTLLSAEGVTRKERLSSDDPVSELDGPILAEGCDQVCIECEAKLVAGSTPTHSLANQLWIGDLPWQLKDLTWAEKMMIAKVRHNRCVIRVASGRGKLVANAIMFATPIRKVYDTLPISRDELSEVLAFVFLGSAKPTDAEFVRTPMFVRRRRVRDALDWLKLNHKDYGALEISEENLNDLPEAGIPCGVDWKQTEDGDSNLVPEAMSVDNTGDVDEGTSSGPCSFAVAGLTGEQYALDDIRTLKMKALDHLKSGGKTLGIGQAETPESTFSNVQLYPQTFPWLFPYGHGGIGNPAHKHFISEGEHKRHLLMYHDKRFQLDLYFPMVAFNDAQIKQAKTSSHLLVDRKKFQDIADRLNRIEPEVLSDLAQRLEQGEQIKTKTPAEQACYELLEDLEHAGARVQGSLTTKKYMRNEVWSLISFKGAPSWFITFSPADINHPLCLYFADNQIKFSPGLRSSDERLKLIAQNPVAAARFFHYMSESFIKHVLGVGVDRPGLYGETDAYYGTVEQQGRLTLHMHMLIWIKSALSPLEIRNRLLNPDQQFQKDLVSYLESCHVGEFLTGTMSEVKAKVPYRPTARKGLHEVIESEEYNPVPEGYSDPTQTLPDAPPPLCDCDEEMCEACAWSDSWWHSLAEVTDDLILRSNVHTCKRPEAGTDYSKKMEPGAKIKREVRGCLRKDGTCSARFPRDVFTKTEVNLEDGYINLKKLEPMINTVTPDVTYLLRCNTDVTSLLSGTSIKAVVAYVSDYITKSSLKIYHMFESVNSVLKRQTVEIGVSPIQKSNCRKLLMQMVNSLTSKLQIGSPMASLYLLKHPDHYTNHKFKPFWWKSYVSFVRAAWGADVRSIDATQTGEGETSADGADQLVLMKTNNSLVGATNIDDYVWRPAAFEHVCLYDYIQMTTRVKRTPKQLAEFAESVKDTRGPNTIVEVDDAQNDWLVDDLGQHPQEDLLDVTAGDVSSHAFHEKHPLWESHYTRCDRNNLETTVPNFVGGALPRMDQGDREYYCCTMLTLFKPWRDPMHLKEVDASWHDGFTEHAFPDKATTLMKHFNIRYECNDARDDYSSLDKQKRRAMPLFDGQGSKGEEGLGYEGEHGEFGEYFEEDPAATFIKGPKQLSKEKLMMEAESVLRTSGWTTQAERATAPHTRIFPEQHLSANQWKARISNIREELFTSKFRNAPDTARPKRPSDEPGIGFDVKLLKASYFTKDFEAANKMAQREINTISSTFNLNTEQDRAFRLVANHATDLNAAPLRMYLGGVGGTGKSQVIKALVEFFEVRSESHRFIVLGPTGTAAALLNGSTYHSVLGLRDSNDNDSERISGARIKKVQERIRGVEYIFLDEVSMVSCSALYSISARLAHSLGEPNEPFGGLNVIFAGDFAQLPPVSAKALYSPDSSVAPLIKSKMSILDQKNTIGKIIWQQITTVVLLTQNMRQTANTPDDEKFRTALTNMRFASCTKDDLKYLQSRTIGNGPGRPSFARTEFRDASIITAFNAQKDKINELGTAKFAKEHGQDLTTFYSDDTIAVNAGDSERKPKEVRKRHTVKARSIIPNHRQQQLWDAHPCFAGEHIPGKLNICLGLPVMIKNNDATELCITKGQEGKVVGWQEGVGNRSQKVLDTLFVELISPPKAIQIPGLPKNVVALPKASKKIWCTLPDDRTMQITREQVLVLPNFAMTDYASQGKTRDINVVDLNNCKDHFSYYTALSRSATSEGTVILQGMDPRKITQGISGYLRQEFRELELLNEITKKRYEGDLPSHVKGINRREMIYTYQAWKGNNYDVDGLHPVLTVGKASDSVPRPFAPMGRWQMIQSDQKLAKTCVTSDNQSKPTNVKKSVKRKQPNQSSSSTLKKRKLPPVALVGMKWDQENYSCAYDALFIGLYHIWQDHGPLWSNRFASITEYTDQLGKGFEAYSMKTRSLETVRNQVRLSLAQANPTGFPTGPVFTYLYILTDTVFGQRFWGRDTIKCLTCGLVSGELEGYPCTRAVYQDAGLKTRYKEEYALSHWLNALKISRAGGRCNACQGSQARIEIPLTAPPVLHFALHDPLMRLDTAFNITVGGTAVRYALRSVIYFGNQHFTSRIVKPNGDIWFHDGIETGLTTLSEGNVHSQGPWFLNTTNRNGYTQTACGAIYAVME